MYPRINLRLLPLLALLLASLLPLPAAHAVEPPAVAPALYLPLAANVRRVIPLELDVRQPALSWSNDTAVFVGVDAAGGTDVYAYHLAFDYLERLTNTPDIVEETPLLAGNTMEFVYAAHDGRSWNLYVRSVEGGEPALLVEDTGADEVQPSYAAGSTHVLFASNRVDGNWDIYRANRSDSLPAQPVRLTTDPAVERFPSGAQGQAVVYRRERTGPSGVESDIYVMDADGSHQRALTSGGGFFAYPAATPAHAGIVYVASGGATPGYGALRTATLGGGGLVELSPGATGLAEPRLSHDGSRLIYTAVVGGRRWLVIETFADPLLQVGRAGYARLTSECSWENGVLAMGWVEAWQATGTPQYGAWVRAWVDGCLGRGASIEHANDVPLAFAALALYAETPDARYWAVAQQAADYIFGRAQRAPDGTIIHLDDMVWDDTLIGITPFLLSMHAASGEDRYLDEAVSQVLKHSQHLQDPATGLYHHAWRPATDSLDGPAFWGRGNGWVLLAVAELLVAMPPDHPQYGAVFDVYRRHAAGLMAHQDSGGRWRTVINRPDAYLETSGSALIAAGLATGLRAIAPDAWLDRKLVATRFALAARGVWSQVGADGVAGGVSAPTWPMPEDEYLQRPISPFERYGQGVVLLMGAAAAARGY